MDLLEFMMGQDIQCYSDLKNMMPFTIGLDTLLVKKVLLHRFFSHNYEKLIHSLPLKITLTLHNIIIHINFNKAGILESSFFWGCVWGGGGESI